MDAVKRGLILEGGAMRGLFTAGIMDVLMEHDIHFDGIVGVSAGAAFGCNFKSRQIGRVLRYNLRFCKDKRYCSWRSWFKTGDLFGADFCYRQLPEELDPFDCGAYDRDPAEFYLVCTDVFTGEAHYQSCPYANRETFEWMRASASMPLVSRIVEIGGGSYLDGAVADSIPLRFFESLGYNRNVVILTQPSGFIKKPSRAMPLLQLALRRYPRLAEKLKQRHLLYNDAVRYVEECCDRGEIFLLRPEAPLPVSRLCHNPVLLKRTWELGREAALKKLADLKNFLIRK